MAAIGAWVVAAQQREDGIVARKEADLQSTAAKRQQDRLIEINARLAGDGRRHATAAENSASAIQEQTGFAGRQLVESNRAWIAPTHIGIAKAEGDAYTVTIGVVNTGKTPAFGVVQGFRPVFMDEAQKHVMGHGVRGTGASPCRNMRPTSGGDVIYPTETTGRSFHMTLLNPADAPFVVRGCFVYRTMGEVRRSEFCQYTDLNEFGKQPKPLTAAVVRYCSNGNYAN
ncbi:MAG: hypothetical protein U0987_05500 [Afipia sp.]|nr:hypothetical protein [Afipia sp.]